MGLLAGIKREKGKKVPEGIQRTFSTRQKSRASAKKIIPKRGEYRKTKTKKAR